MILRQQLKFNARRALAGNWSRAVAMALILAAIILLFVYLNATFEILLAIPALDELAYPFVLTADLAERGLLSGFLLLSAIAVQAPLCLGATSWFYDLGGADEGEVSDVFLFFESPSRYGRALSLTVSLLLRRLFWLLLCCLPGALAIGGGHWLTPLLAGMGLLAKLPGFIVVFGWALLVLGLPAFFVVQTRYALAPYYLFENPALSARKALRLSVSATRGQRFSLAVFDLSFAGWFLLCVLALPLLYVCPYYSTSRGLYARYLITLAARRTEA